MLKYLNAAGKVVFPRLPWAVAASELDNDSSVAGATIKDALQTLNPERYRVRKPSAESVLNSTAVQDDDHLQHALTAGATYEGEFVLHVTCGASAIAGFRFALTFPAGCSLTAPYIAMDSGLTVQGAGVVTVSGTEESIRVTGATALAVHMPYSLLVGGTAGTLKLRWAQRTTDPVIPTVVEAGSKLRAERIA